MHQSHGLLYISPSICGRSTLCRSPTRKIFLNFSWRILKTQPKTFWCTMKRVQKSVQFKLPRVPDWWLAYFLPYVFAWASIWMVGLGSSRIHRNPGCIVVKWWFHLTRRSWDLFHTVSMASPKPSSLNGWKQILVEHVGNDVTHHPKWWICNLDSDLLW